MGLSRIALAAAFAAVPSALLAASTDPTPPTPTETTQVCEDGTIWDADTRACVAPKDASLNDSEFYDAARELAYAGRFEDAGAALDAMSDQSASDVLTYRGFLARKTGDWERAEAFYVAALTIDPGNHLARSYFGQGLHALGDIDGARAQLSEIRARGGRNTWAEAALALSLAGGATSGY